MLHTTPRTNTAAPLPAALADPEEAQDAIVGSADFIDLRDRYKAALLRARTMDRLDVALQKADTVSDILGTTNAVIRFLNMPRPRLDDPAPRPAPRTDRAPSNGAPIEDSPRRGANERVSPAVRVPQVTPSTSERVQPSPADAPSSSTPPAQLASRELLPNTSAPVSTAPADCAPQEPHAPYQPSNAPVAPAMHTTGPSNAPANAASPTTSHPPFT